VKIYCANPKVIHKKSLFELSTVTEKKSSKQERPNQKTNGKQITSVIVRNENAINQFMLVDRLCVWVFIRLRRGGCGAGGF
jgi:hypothetical protein